ncbi:MAG TPA: hypothetical protein PLW50_00140 [Smithellaceae bacterium]|nr:hypothetical protein [Smithellaceae bacterium]
MVYDPVVKIEAMPPGFDYDLMGLASGQISEWEYQKDWGGCYKEGEKKCGAKKSTDPVVGWSCVHGKWQRDHSFTCVHGNAYCSDGYGFLDWTMNNNLNYTYNQVISKPPTPCSYSNRYSMETVFENRTPVPGVPENTMPLIFGTSLESDNNKILLGMVCAAGVILLIGFSD